MTKRGEKYILMDEIDHLKEYNAKKCSVVHIIYFLPLLLKLSKRLHCSDHQPTQRLLWFTIDPLPTHLKL